MQKRNVIIILVIAIVIAVSFFLIGGKYGNYFFSKNSPAKQSAIDQSEKKGELSPSKGMGEVQSPPAIKTSSIMITLKDDNGKFLSGFKCNLETNNADNSVMVVKTSVISDEQGVCKFLQVEPGKSYVVRVYWNEDGSVNSYISLGTVGPGEAVEKEEVRAIHAPVNIVTIAKDKNGNRISGKKCELQSNKSDNSKMVVLQTKTTDGKGECQFFRLDNSKPYVVRVYWTKDMGTVSQVSYGKLAPGSTKTLEAIKP